MSSRLEIGNPREAFVSYGQLMISLGLLCSAVVLGQLFLSPYGLQDGLIESKH